MSIQEEVAAGVSQALAPIAENLINSLSHNIGISKESPLLAQLSGKKVVIDIGEITITIPDLTKPHA